MPLPSSLLPPHFPLCPVARVNPPSNRTRVQSALRNEYRRPAPGTMPNRPLSWSASTSISLSCSLAHSSLSSRTHHSPSWNSVHPPRDSGSLVPVEPGSGWRQWTRDQVFSASSKMSARFLSCRIVGSLFLSCTPPSVPPPLWVPFKTGPGSFHGFEAARAGGEEVGR